MNKKTKKSKNTADETDATYILKLVLFFMFGAIWLRFDNGNSLIGIPLPLGFIVGLLFASHEHFQIDRKLEYAVMVVAMFVSFFLPLGLVVQL